MLANIRFLNLYRLNISMIFIDYNSILSYITQMGEIAAVLGKKIAVVLGKLGHEIYEARIYPVGPFLHSFFIDHSELFYALVALIIFLGLLIWHRTFKKSN